MNKFFIVLFGVFFSTACSLVTDRLPESARPKGVAKEKPILNMVWSKNLDPIHNTGNLPIAVHSPYIYEGILYAGHGNGYMMAYDLENGRELWRKNDEGAYHAGPKVYNGMLIYGTRQGRVFARDYLTGELIYSVDLESSIESVPVIENGRLFFHLRNHRVFSLDAATGKILWAYRRSVPFTTTVQGVSRPLVYEGKVIIGFADGSVAALNIEDGVLLWDIRLGDGSNFVDVDINPTLINNQLAVSSLEGDLKFVDPNSGQIIRRLDITPSRAPLILSGQRMMVGTTRGQLVVFDRHFARVFEKSFARVPITNIVPWKNGHIVTLASKEIYWVSPDFENVSQVFDMGHAHSAVLGDVSLSDQVLAFISARHRLYVFK